MCVLDNQIVWRTPVLSTFLLITVFCCQTTCRSVHLDSTEADTSTTNKWKSQCYEEHQRLFIHEELENKES